MNKKLIIFVSVLATLGIVGISQAQVSNPNLWKLVSNAIFPVKSTWEFGSATSRIQKGWFNNLDANNATIGSIGVSGSVAGDMVVSGQIRNATGTAAAPSYSFNADTNTGLYSGGADILKFANGGADSLTILANGNMGVATATPAYKMDINGSLRANSTITFNSLASTTNTLVAVSTAGTLSSIANNSANWNDAYTNRITGAVAPLSLSSNSLSIPAASASVNGYLATSTFATFNNKVSSQWTTNGTSVYYTTGSVGIGTTNPTDILSIVKNTASANATKASIQNTNIAGDSQFIVYGDNVTNNLALQFINSNYPTAAYRNTAWFTTAGSVALFGINTNGDVNHNGTTPIEFIAGGYGNVPTIYISPGNPGTVGIGLTNPSYKLDVSGSIHGTSYYSSDGTIGTSTTINVRKADDTGACTITVKNGLITTTTCP